LDRIDIIKGRAKQKFLTGKSYRGSFTCQQDISSGCVCRKVECIRSRSTVNIPGKYA
jgi:hypothetical protein